MDAHNDVVSDVSYAGLAMRGDILGLERRRRWGDDDKLSIVLSVATGRLRSTLLPQALRPLGHPDHLRARARRCTPHNHGRLHCPPSDGLTRRERPDPRPALHS